MTPTLPGPGNPDTTENDEAVAALVAERGIAEVLHFTTAPPGMVGVCATGAVLSRDRLKKEKHVQYIYKPNCATRTKDPDWTDHVSLSITTVNKWMLDKSTEWHADEGIWWAVLSFDPVILTHPGVYFTTTNNTYPNVHRATGRAGLDSMFANTVLWGYWDTPATRWSGMPANLPTQSQAEVLYPGRVSLKYLRAVYVAEAEHTDDVKTWVEMFSTMPTVPVAHRPEIFA